jgi:hypothetical protein
MNFKALKKQNCPICGKHLFRDMMRMVYRCQREMCVFIITFPEFQQKVYEMEQRHLELEQRKNGRPTAQ